MLQNENGFTAKIMPYLWILVWFPGELWFTSNKNCIDKHTLLFASKEGCASLQPGSARRCNRNEDKTRNKIPDRFETNSHTPAPLTWQDRNFKRSLLRAEIAWLLPDFYAEGSLFLRILRRRTSFTRFLLRKEFSCIYPKQDKRHETTETVKRPRDQRRFDTH